MGDVLRPNPANLEMNQRLNIDCLHTLLRGPLAASGINSSSITEYLNHAKYRDFTTEFYAGFQLSPGQESWARLYRNAWTKQSVPREFAMLLSGKTVVGFELSPAIQHLLTVLGTTFIDIRLHPLRCLPDLVFCFKSNSSALQRRLSDWRMSEEFALCHLSMLKSKLRRFESFPELAGSIVFLGQVRGDADLIEDGHFYPDAVVVAEVEKIRQGRQLYVKPHPQDPANPIIQIMLNSIPGSRRWDNDFYGAACASDTTSFIGISSCACYEAALLGNDTTFLSKYAFTPDSTMQREYIPILFEYMYPAFWRHIFSLYATSNRVARRHTREVFVPNALRSTLYQTSSLSSSSVPAAPKLAAHSHNLIINGGFDIWQRGKKGQIGYVTDRFRAYSLGATQVVQEYSHDVPDASATASLRLSISGPSSSDYGVRQTIEDGATYLREPLTLTGWAKGPAGAKAWFGIQDFGEFLTLTGAWQYITLTRSIATPHPSHHTWIDVLRGCTHGGDYFVTNLALTAGSCQVTPERRPPSVETLLCERYFQILRIASGFCERAESAMLTFALPTPMRADPRIYVAGEATLMSHSGDHRSSTVKLEAMELAPTGGGSAGRFRLTGFQALPVGATVWLKNTTIGVESEI